jgi:hypothetical protein
MLATQMQMSLIDSYANNGNEQCGKCLSWHGGRKNGHQSMAIFILLAFGKGGKRLLQILKINHAAHGGINGRLRLWR